jgi:hypothetical protein
VPPATAPGAVSSVMVKAGNGAVTVSWQVPLSIGGAPVTSYKVTSSPGAKTCTTSATSCTVSGLSDGATYTFFVVAVNAAGAGPRTTSRAVRVSVRPPQYYIGPFRAGSSTLSAAQEIRIVSIGLAIVRGHYRSVVVSGYAAASSTLAHQRAAVVGAYLVTVLHSMRATAGQLHRWGLSNPLVITIYQTRNSTLTQGAGVTLVK